MKQYVKLRFRSRTGRARTVWAVKTSPLRYVVCDKYGETERLIKSVDGQEVYRKELIITSASDILSERSAVMSKTYAELEVTKK